MIAPPAEETVLHAARRLGARLDERRMTLASAESSTGGLLGHAITGVPGSSRYYLGGVIAYSNAAKQAELDVPAGLLGAVGAVSAEVAVAMATGVRERLDADLGLATTGIAGPDGATTDKPLGLHFVAAAMRGREPMVERHVFPHDRAGNKLAAAHAALRLGLRAMGAG